MVVLTDSLTVDTIEENRRHLLVFLQEQGEKKEKEAVLDVSNLRDIDTAGVQLLLSAHKSAAQKGNKFYLVNTDEFISKMLEFSGAGHILFNA